MSALVTRRAAAGAALLAAVLVLGGCERPPVDYVQRGFRGTGMQHVANPRTMEAKIADNQLPPALPAVPADGPRATEVYKNVQVLTNLSAAELVRTMTAMASWIAPVEGCVYCHNLENLAEDAKYTKVVARNMLRMTQSVNTQWQAHVATTGVTCWTCHRGNAIPKNVWFAAPPQDLKSNFIGDRAEQNIAAPLAGLTSLPADPFSPFLKDALPLRVIGAEPLPGVDGANNRASIKQAEYTYGLMMHMSDALGVNCTYCHNSRSFASWDGPPQRATAWYGIRMAREINNRWMEPLKANFPAHRLGPLGDVAKVNCMTCHQGAYKPLFGASMAKDYPEFTPAVASPAAAAAVPAAPAGLLAKVLFAVGRADLSADARMAIGTAAGALQKFGALKVDLSGFADRTGSADKNLDLAKRRAFAVRDALQSAGVDAARITLKKPEFVVGGASDDARRVDILVAR